LRMVATDGAFSILLDPSRDVADRIAALADLGDASQMASIEALTRVAQQLDVPDELAEAVGRMLGQLCFGRGEDVHELDLAMFSDAAGDAYDQEIGRLQRLNPGTQMKRRAAGSGR